MALVLAVVALFADSPSAEAQTPPTSTITVRTTQTSAYEGGLATFILERYGGGSAPLQVQVKTWEPNAESEGSNDTELTHRVRFLRGTRRVLLHAIPFTDLSTSESDPHTLNAQVMASDDGKYRVGTQDSASISILERPTDNSIPVIRVQRSQTSVDEGETTTLTFTRTGGDTTQPLTVDIEVYDPRDFLRGDYWDAPPEIPTQVQFGAGSTSETVDLRVPDDGRDLLSDGVTLDIVPSHDYLLWTYNHNVEELSAAPVYVSDNDTAQELELNFGKDGTNDADVTEGDTLKIKVKRRQQDADTGETEAFTVRVETTRRANRDNTLEGWKTDYSYTPNRLYKDFDLEITGSDLEVEQSLDVPENGITEGDWKYWAKILPILDHEGDPVSDSEEAEYWTVKSGFRETAIDATDNGDQVGTVTLTTSQASVYEGGGVTYTLTRTGGPIGVGRNIGVRTHEPNRASGGNNPSNQTNFPYFPPWVTTITYTVSAYVDGVAEDGTDTLKASVVGNEFYGKGTPSSADVEINDPPSDSTLVTMSASPTSLQEGGPQDTSTITFTRAGGDTTQELTINVGVEDPHNFLRGNLYDPAPDIPTQVTFEANSTTATMTITPPDDDRDLSRPAALVTISVLPGTGYLLGVGSESVISVTDNDTKQVLSLDLGFIDPSVSAWEDGESYACTGEDCTPGPAEGFYYYEDDRDHRFADEFEEPWPIHFEVSRRAQDTGNTATFVVRVEHNRGWIGPRHADWSIDPETGNHYKDFPLTLSGDQRKVIGRIEVTNNGLIDPNNWKYTASIRQLEDVNGVPLTGTQEGQYWTIKGSRPEDRVANRTKTVTPSGDAGYPALNIQMPSPKQVQEGGEVTFTVERKRGNPYADLPVQIRTWEPNHNNPDGTNPTEQIHNLVFPAAPVTSLFQNNNLTQTLDIVVTATDDDVFETSDLLRIEMLSPTRYFSSSSVKGQVTILDDDKPTITLTADQTSITEGGTVVFTLTRGNNTTGQLNVGVEVDDPGGFLQGDYAADPEGVETPSSVMFADGEATKTIAITPPDDRRDISDDSLTFMVEADPGYEILGTNPRTVQVTDNDVAPQVQISFNHEEVEEGQDLTLIVKRIGEDKNDLEIPMTGGRADDQRFTVIGMDPGQSQANLRYRLPDDDVKGPDVEYSFTLMPENLEFWTIVGEATVSAKIVDNDPYRVSVRTFRSSVDEGENIYYRVQHDGYTDKPLQVKVEHSEEGNAVGDGILKQYTHTIPAGASGITRGFESQAGDGSDGDAIFTVALVEDDAYEIVSDRAEADMVVVDTDPLPVLRFKNDPLIEANEADGTVEHVIDLVSDLPVLRGVTVEYQVQEQFISDGADVGIADTPMTLTIPAGSTSGTIEIPVVQDLVAEADETVYVYLRNPVNATLQDGASSIQGWVVIEDDEPEVTLDAAQAAVNEGDDAVFTLTRDEDTSAELTVWVQVFQSAPVNTNTQETVVFAAGDNTATLTIPTEGYDAGGGASMTISAFVLDPPDIGETRTYWLGSSEAAVVEVRDTDLPGVSIYPENFRVTEGETVRFRVARRSTTRGAITVNLVVEETGSYTTGTIPATATIPSGDSDVYVEISTQNDDESEDTGELTVSIGPGTRYVSVYPSSVTFGIFDNDSTLPTVRVDGAEEWVNEGSDVTFTFTRTGSLTDSLDARVRLYRLRSRVTTADLEDTTRGITTPRDLIAFDEEDLTVTFPADTATVTVTRSTVDDSLNYGNSSYHAVVQSGPDDPYVSRFSYSAQVWVQDDDRPEVTLSLVDNAYYTHSQQPYPGVFRVRPNDLFVDYTLERTGDTSGHLPIILDTFHTLYRPAPLEDRVLVTDAVTPDVGVTIPQGVSSHDAEFPNSEYVNSLGRTHTLTLQDPHNCPDDPSECGYGPQYTLGSSQEITITIHSLFMGLGIEADQTTVAEGGSATFTLHRQGGIPGALARPLEVKIGVTQDGDYITGTTVEKVTFLANESTATVTVNTENDDIDEADGAVTVTILAPDSYDDDEKAYEVRQYPVPLWEDFSATTTVTDNDYILPNVSVGDAIGKEQDGTIEFTISLDAANNEEVATVQWATAEDGTDSAATSGTDFTADSGTVTFAIGETEKTVTVTLLDDDLDEAHETFNVVLSSPAAAAIVGGTATGTILDDELAAAVIFSSPYGGVEEGETLRFRVKRLPLRNPGETISSDDPCYDRGGSYDCFNIAATAEDLPDALEINVKVTEEGDVISGTAPATVTFPPGSVYAFLEIPTVDDSTIEPDGVVTAQVLNGSGYSPLFLERAEAAEDALPTHFGTVYDNDLTFSIADASATEGTDTAVDFTVSLNAPAPQEVSIFAATIDGTATSLGNEIRNTLGPDFTAKSETITFSTGEQTRTFSVSIEDDTIQEKDETFTVQLSNKPQYTTVADDTAVGTIVDNEERMVASVTRTYSVVDEDQSGPARFMVTLSHPTTTNHERSPAVAWRTTAGSATEGEDYVGGSGTLIFPRGQTSGFIDVDIRDDNLVEAMFETFDVELVAADSRLVTLSSTQSSFGQHPGQRVADRLGNCQRRKRGGGAGRRLHRPLGGRSYHGGHGRHLRADRERNRRSLRGSLRLRFSHRQPDSSQR